MQFSGKQCLLRKTNKEQFRSTMNRSMRKQCVKIKKLISPYLLIVLKINKVINK